MGEFLDLLAGLKNPEGVLFFRWALQNVQPNNLHAFRQCPFCREGIKSLLRILIPTMSERFAVFGRRKGSADEELAAAHEFLEAIYAVAVRHDIPIALSEVNVPLTETGTGIAKGNMRVSNGAIVLTKKGKALAEKTRAQLRGTLR